MSSLGRNGSGRGVELELEFRANEASKAQNAADSFLLTVETGEDILDFGIGQTSGQVGRPVVPKGADGLVEYYEKQLASAQLVNQRLQDQYNQLVEEKASLEASFHVESAAMQQQLAVVHDKASHAKVEADRLQREVEAARTATELIVDSVSQMAEHLDALGAAEMLTQCFEAIAQRTQAAHQAVITAQACAQAVSDLQRNAVASCLESPLTAPWGATAPEAPTSQDVQRGLHADIRRLQEDLLASRRREEELTAEVNAAQLLFASLEAEVVSLQQDQAQAAARLHVTEEELTDARSQLVSAKRSLDASEHPAAEDITEGLTKLDKHLACIRDFRAGLSVSEQAEMPSVMPSQEQLSTTQKTHSSLSDKLAPARKTITLYDEAAACGVPVPTVPVLEKKLAEADREVEMLQKDLSATGLKLSAAAAREAALLARVVQLEGMQTDISVLGISPTAGVVSPLTQRSARSTMQSGCSDILSPKSGTSPPGSPSYQCASRIPRPPASVHEQRQPGSQARSDGGMLSPSGRSAIPIPAPQQQRAEKSAATIAALEEQVKRLEASRADAEGRADSYHREKELTALLLHQLGEEQETLAEQLRALEVDKDTLEAEQGQLLSRMAELSSRMGDLEAERDILHSRVVEMQAHADALEAERDRLLEQRERELGVAVAAGAAGAAAAVAVANTMAAAPAAVVSDSGSDPEDALPANSLASGVQSAPDAPLEQRIADLEADIADITQERDAAMRRSARLEEELVSMGELLQQAADEREAALQHVEQMMVERAAEDERFALQRSAFQGELHAAESAAAAATAAAAAAAAGAAAGIAAYQSSREVSGALALTGGPSPRLSWQRPGRQSDSRRVSFGSADEPGDRLSALQARSSERLAVRASSSLTAGNVMVHSYSEMPLVPARAFNDADGTYLLDPSEPLDGPTRRQSCGAALDLGAWRPSSMSDVHERNSSRGSSTLTPRVSAVKSPKLQNVGTTDEITQLQTAVCSLLVSKALAVAQLQAEHEAEFAVVHAAHQAQLQSLQAQQDAELQLCAAAGWAQAPAVQRRDRSTRVSRSSMSGCVEPAWQSDAEVFELKTRLQFTEGELAHFQCQLERLQQEHASQIAQLQAEYDAHVWQLEAERQGPSALSASRSPDLSSLHVGPEAEGSTSSLQQSSPAARAAAVHSSAGEHIGEIVRLRARIADLEASISDLQLQGMQEADAHHGQLEKLRAAHDVAISELRSEHLREMAALEASYDTHAAEAQLQHDAALTEAQLELSAKLYELNAQQQAELSKACEGHDAQLSSLRAEHQLQQAQAQAALNAQRSELQAHYREQLAEAQAELDAQRTEVEAQRLTLSDEVQVQLAAHVSQLHTQHQADLSEAQAAWDARLREIQTQHSAQLAATLKQHDAQIADLRDACDEQTVTFNQAVEQSAEAAFALQQLRLRLSESEAAHEAELAEVEALHSAHVEDLSRAAQDSAAEAASAAPSLQAEITTLLAAHEEVVSQLHAAHRSQLAEMHSAQRAEVADLQEQLAAIHTRFHELEAATSPLRQQLAQLQEERELSEQSLHSLQSAKSWLTNQVRDLQAELKESNAKLMDAEAQLAEVRAVAASSADTTDQMLETIEIRQELDKTALQIGALADQLAESVMHAALAEACFEDLQQSRKRLDSSDVDRSDLASPASQSGQDLAATQGPSLEQASMMMETLTLHSELDELKAKHRSLQTLIDDLADELTDAVLRASLAEVQLEELRLLRSCAGQMAERSGGRSRLCESLAAASQCSTQPGASVRGPQPGACGPDPLEICSNSGTDGATVNSKRPAYGMSPPDHLGTKAVSPLEQTRHLRAELEAVASALTELFGEDLLAVEPAQRQALSTVRPAVIAALNMADNVALTLRQQGQNAAAATSSDIHEESQSRQFVAKHLDHERARQAYHEARSVFDMLRSDAEDLNSRLWRWGSSLRQQVSVLERQLAGASVGGPPDPESQMQQLVNRHTAGLHSAEMQMSGMQSDLHAAHELLLRRDREVALLQDALVELSEQMSMLEGVVSQCEYFSADVMSRTGASALRIRVLS